MRRLPFAFAGLLGAALASTVAHAEAPVQRTVTRLPSANGHGAVILDLSTRRLTHFREHLFATEEPVIDASGNDVWVGNQPQSIATRDVAYDAYFGLRHDGTQAWLTSVPADADASGYAPWAAGKTGGTGIATLVQKVGALEVTTFVFAPRGLGHPGFVMAARVRNTGATKASGVALFSIHNFHLGFGRPGVMAKIAENGETISYDAGKGDFLERGFAGVVVTRGLGSIGHHAAWNGASPAAANAFSIVDSGAGDLPDVSGDQPTADGSVSAFQSASSDLDPGAEAWFGVVAAHAGDPFAGPAVQGFLDAYAAGKSAKDLVDAETAEWAAFQQKITIPAGASADEETVLRHQATMLKLAQVEDDTAYLREVLSKDGEPRRTRFGTTLGGAAATLPATIKHRGKGAVLASLPPGEWTVTWSRDTAYSIAAMSAIGMKDEAAAALGFYLGAEAGRFQQWNELKPYAMPPYQISLVRYFGFGVEETDVNDFGPNLEFDGFGLFLWALGQYETKTKDTSIADGAWMAITTKVADPIVALIDPATGLVKPDSSIWELHWNGRQRSFAYTSITAVRGLCDAAAIADRKGDTAHATTYRNAANGIRKALATQVTDPTHALGVSHEGVMSGKGYWDAAVLDAIAMGLFDPKGPIAKATLAGLDAHLATTAGAGWSRSDDKTDGSPWGGDYDSAEWIFTDMRGALAERMSGDVTRSDRLYKWVREQTLANYLEVSETYDESTGVYKFNAPMIGFGAGAWALALAGRDAPADPACGAYYDESGTGTGGSGGAGGSGAGGTGASGKGGASAGGGTSVGGAPSTGGTGPSTGGSSPVGTGGSTSGVGGGASGKSGAAGGTGGAPGTSGGVQLPTTTPPANDTSADAPGCSCGVVGREPGGFVTALLGLGALVATRRARGRRRA
jgi:hypothetical protein